MTDAKQEYKKGNGQPPRYQRARDFCLDDEVVDVRSYEALKGELDVASKAISEGVAAVEALEARGIHIATHDGLPHAIDALADLIETWAEKAKARDAYAVQLKAAVRKFIEVCPYDLAVTKEWLDAGFRLSAVLDAGPEADVQKSPESIQVAEDVHSKPPCLGPSVGFDDWDAENTAKVWNGGRTSVTEQYRTVWNAAQQEQGKWLRQGGGQTEEQRLAAALKFAHESIDSIIEEAQGVKAMIGAALPTEPLSPGGDYVKCAKCGNDKLFLTEPPLGVGSGQR